MAQVYYGCGAQIGIHDAVTGETHMVSFGTPKVGAPCSANGSSIVYALSVPITVDGHDMASFKAGTGSVGTTPERDR